MTYRAVPVLMAKWIGFPPRISSLREYSLKPDLLENPSRLNLRTLSFSGPRDDIDDYN